VWEKIVEVGVRLEKTNETNLNLNKNMEYYSED
jgi:hypothetical protein